MTRDEKIARMHVLARDDHRCRRCGFWPVAVAHHICPSDRRRKVHDPDRMIAVCQGPGTNDCHGWIHLHPAESYEQGWLARAGAEGNLEGRCGRVP